MNRHGGLARWAGLLALWLAVAVTTALYAHLQAQTRGQSAPWLGFFLFQLVVFAPWVLLTPVVARLIERRAPLAIHLGCAVGAVAVSTAFVAVSSFLLEGQALDWGGLNARFRALTVPMIPSQLFSYGAVAAVSYGLRANRESRLRELQASRLEASLTDARLRMLRMQIDPHFLFNTLNSIAILIRRGERDTAEQMVARLGELLRTTLDDRRGPMVTLAEELETVDRYLQIERVRFRDRLDVRIDLPDRVRTVKVPSLILQPLVENAIHHGIARARDAGRLAIEAEEESGKLRVSVCDDGPGPPEPGLMKEGVGLTNVRERLAQIYGDAGSVGLTRAESGGARAELRIPLQVGGS